MLIFTSCCCRVRVVSASSSEPDRTLLSTPSSQKEVDATAEKSCRSICATNAPPQSPGCVHRFHTVTDPFP